MKKSLLFLLILFSTALFSQENKKIYNNELKLDALHLIFGNINLSYEFLLNENSGFTVYGEYNLDNNQLWDIQSGFGAAYRLYVGSRYASGFFVEGGVSGYVIDNEYYDEHRYSTSIGPTIALGGKFMIRQNTVFEFFGGLGRNFLPENDNKYYDYTPVIPRFGVSIGRRF